MSLHLRLRCVRCEAVGALRQRRRPDEEEEEGKVDVVVVWAPTF
jgi:hypothetical protein